TEYEVFPEKRITKWAAFGHVGYAPIIGKFALFNSWVVHFDVYIFAGGGVTHTAGNRPTGVFGVGSRMFLNKFLSINWEIRDQLYRETFNAGKSIVNNVVFSVGLTMFIPFGFKYKGLK
ncbi:MAG: outer membrane beta-barrel domain-containing protein, partial [Myxococcales bacterium]|nr:outer membrane beta-barrel domain-containing protein [Myxococcales bacterium]